MKTLFFIIGMFAAIMATSIVRANDQNDKNDLLKLLELQTGGMPPSFVLVRLDADLNKISKAVYLSKAVILTEAANQVSKTNINDVTDRLFVMNAILPVIQGIHTEYFEREVIPAYNKAIADENSRHGVRSLADLRYAPMRKEITLQLLRRGLEVISSDFGATEDQRSLGSMKAVVGMALASGSEADFNRCASVLASHQDLLIRASVAERTESVGMMLSALAESLK